MSETPVGLTKDAGWEVGVSRTVPAPLDAVWEAVRSGGWLGTKDPFTAGEPYACADGTTGEMRSVRERDRVRLTWSPPARPAPATLGLVVRPAATGTSIRFHAERLTDAGERERMRESGRAALARLAASA